MSNKTVNELMIPRAEVEAVKEKDFFRDALESLDHNVWGAVFIVDEDDVLKGIITDGDARRILVKNQNPLAMLNTTPVSKFMTKEPKRITGDAPAIDALNLMSEKMIAVLPVVNEDNVLVGLVHIQHAIRHFIREFM